jgi:single-stranded DNA-specific DHH superfamily exonuclease
LRGLALLGAPPETLHYVVPDRAVHGYGLTPTIVDLALECRPDVLITVDNGIASLDGVAHCEGARPRRRRDRPPSAGARRRRRSRCPTPT